jgi:uncharacterized repeat protein (TIGR03943 family)
VSADTVTARSASLNRQAQAVVMLLLGGAVVRAGLTGLYLRYVKAGLRPLLIAAGVLLIVAAVMTLWYELRPAAPSADETHHHETDDDGHGHGRHEPRIGWLLMLPVLGLLLVVPPALGSFSAAQAGSVLSAPSSGSDYAALPAGDPVSVGLLDYASRAVFDGGKSLTGRDVKLTGFVAPGADGKPMLARIIMTCCAADARPVKVALSGDVPTGLPANAWVSIVGTYVPSSTRDPVNQAVVPYVAVRTWQQISAPDQPYEPDLPFQ